MIRLGWTALLKPELAQRYRALHADPPEAILDLLRRGNINDYTIYLDELSGALFATFGYKGKDFNNDMANIAADPAGATWDALTRSCQVVPDGATDAWRPLVPIFRMD